MVTPPTGGYLPTPGHIDVGYVRHYTCTSWYIYCTLIVALYRIMYINLWLL